MSKILAVSDIHIHDYPQRNPEDKYRLYQSRIVARNIIEVGKAEGADIIVFAGDIMEKSIVKPYILAEVKLFLDTIMKHFRVGYIIWGNHDQDNKGNIQEFIDSPLSVMLPENLKYADKQVVVIDGTRIGFSNWQPEFDLSWINNPVDILFTHATICYNGGDDYFKSQVLDESKFNLAICGDIHKPGAVGKYVSIGIPQRCKMSDSEISSGIILDCKTKNYKWVNLNPANNLMKFEYTTNPKEEGWDGNNGVWKVFKPGGETKSSSKMGNLNIPAWDEVSNLIDNVIDSSGLRDVHREILKYVKNIDINGVDFNFTLTRFYCKNWRSIDEVELYFNDGDKILITGKNGAGKSSLLTAIKYAFLENKFLKDFIQFGEKECYTEVEFLYQGSTYKIGRGTKKYGLWVNGEQMKYGNKSSFNEDLRIRFPFINYMDIYFFDSDHHKLIGDITPERKSEIISKFFKLDRIETLNLASKDIIDKYSEKRRQLSSKIDSSRSLAEFIESKINLINLPPVTKDEIISLKTEGIEIQRKYEIWKKFESDFNIATSALELRKLGLKEKIDSSKKYRDLDSIDKDIKELKQEIDDIMSKYILNNPITDIKSEISEITRRIAQINNDGKKLYDEWKNADSLKICSKCGQMIKNPELIDKHKLELENQMNQLISERDEKQKRLEELKSKLHELEPVIDSKKILYNKKSQELSELTSERQLSLNIREEIKLEQNYVSVLEKQIDSMKSSMPEKIELPENFIQRMAELEGYLTTWDQYLSLKNDLDKESNLISTLQTDLKEIERETEGLIRYNKLTGPTGKIYEEIMNKLAKQFSDNQVKYEVSVYTFRNIDHLDLVSSYNNNGNYVSYQACSSGQRTILDINFLSKIVTRMGLLVMDEFLKHLDPLNHDICIETISGMNIGCIMLSSHMESIITFNNKTCKLELNDSGITKINLL